VTNAIDNLKLDRQDVLASPTRRSMLHQVAQMGAIAPVAASFMMSPASAQELPPIAGAKDAFKLPAPQTSGGMPVMDALKARHSTREYADRPLPAQMLSDLLWAAWGINRSEEGLRTAPSTHGKAAIDIYLAMANGVWRYSAADHALLPHLAEDLRAATSTGQPFVKTAAVNLIYVADAARVGNVSEDDWDMYAVADAAVIGQNVYLFCASAGLGTVIRGSVDGKQLIQRMKLPASQRIRLCQSVGYPRG
jgi:nitroreductase